MVQVTISITGDKALDRAFRTLPAKMQRRVIRPAVSAQATVLVREIRRRAPSRGRTEQYLSRAGVERRRGIGLKRSIRKRAWSKPERGIIGQVVGAGWPEGAHAHLVEFGHRIVTHDGRVVGTARPHPFQRPAMDASGGRMRSRGQQVARQKFRKLTTR